MHQITITPLQGHSGWALEHQALQPIVFRSGAAAEEAARGLSARLAQAGLPVLTTVLLRDGVVVGLFRFDAG